MVLRVTLKFFKKFLNNCPLFPKDASKIFLHFSKIFLLKFPKKFFLENSASLSGGSRWMIVSRGTCVCPCYTSALLNFRNYPSSRHDIKFWKFFPIFLILPAIAASFEQNSSTSRLDRGVIKFSDTWYPLVVGCSVALKWIPGP